MALKLLLASGNPGKLVEFRDLLSSLGWDLPGLDDLNIHPEVDETGRSYGENAALKARAYAAQSGLPALSDDSGLEVDALGGAPGLRSRRFVPQPGATDHDRRIHLLDRLSGHRPPWTARLRCVAAVAWPDGRSLFGEGVCEGQIIAAERGLGGFGYDPLFQLPDGRTMAELTREEKNRLSHRARAILDLLPRLLLEMGR